MKNIKQLIGSQNQRTALIKKNIFASLAIKGVSIVTSFLLVPLTIGYVSSEKYGIWLTLSSIVTWLSFLDAGFSQGLKNRLAEAVAMENWERAKSLVSTTYFVMAGIFIPVLVALEILAPFVNWSSFINVSPSYEEEIQRVMYILVAFFCLSMIINTFVSVVSALQKVALSQSFNAIGNLIALGAIYALTKLVPPSLSYLALTLTLFPLLVTLVGSIVLFNTKFKKIKPSIKSIDTKYVKDIFSLGYKFFFLQIQVVVLFQTINILISNVSGPNDVTSYNIAYKYLGIATMVYNIIIMPLWPAFTDAYTKKDYPWMKNIYRKMTFISGITVLGIILLIAASPLVYNLWIGNKADIPFLMTLLVGVYMIVHSWSSLNISVINGIGKVQLQLYVTMLGLFLQIPLALFLGKYFSCYGVVISLIFITTIYSITWTVQVKKLLNQTAVGIWNK